MIDQLNTTQRYYVLHYIHVLYIDIHRKRIYYSLDISLNIKPPTLYNPSLGL